MGSEKIQKDLDTVATQLDNAPTMMRIFLLSMRSLFTENAVGTSSSTAQKFQKLRDDTRNNAVVYVKGVLPVVKQCVSDIKSYFEYYEELTMDQWWQSIDYIIEAAKANEQACDALVEIHQGIITELKKRRDGATTLMSEMTDLSAEYEKKAQKLQESADYKNAWAIGLLFVPVVNVLAYPLLRRSAFGDLVVSDEQRTEAEIQIAAAGVVKKTLVPALSKFIDGLQEFASFFAVIHEELETFRNRGENAKDAEQYKLLHFNIMSKKASKIMGSCVKFFAVLPSIRSDLDAIPTEGTDQKYVDGWIEKQTEIIRNRCSSNRFVENAIKAIQDGSR